MRQWTVKSSQPEIITDHLYLGFLHDSSSVQGEGYNIIITSRQDARQNIMMPYIAVEIQYSMLHA